MTTSAGEPRRFRFSLRTLIGGVMLTALMLTAFGVLPRPVEGDGEVLSEEFVGPTMGARYSVRFHWQPSRGPRPPILQTYVDERLAQINRLMSTYDPGSELSRFNQSESTDWFEVSPETATVAAYALQVAEQSDGAYDPTVGPLVNLWGFGPGERRGEPPTDAEINAAKDLVGWRRVEARVSPPSLKKTRPDVYLDLSSVAKGYASDAVSRLLDKRGAGDSMVEIGGEVRTRGCKRDGSPWRIGIEKPDARSGRIIQGVVELAGDAVATSGDAYNFFESDGVRYSHTINPQTGRPVTHTTAAVTVRAADCMTADAQATALLVMGADAGYDWAEGRGIAAMFLSRTGDGFQQTTTPAWDAAITAPEE